MDEQLQQQFDTLADAIKQKLIATLDMKIDLISCSPLDELEYRVTKQLINMGITAKSLSVCEALYFRDRLEAAFVMAEDNAR